MIQELKRLTKVDLLKQMTEYSVPIDHWFDVIPVDIEVWEKQWEHHDVASDEIYCCFVKHTCLGEDDFIVNGYISKFKP